MILYLSQYLWRVNPLRLTDHMSKLNGNEVPFQFKILNINRGKDNVWQGKQKCGSLALWASGLWKMFRALHT